MHFTKSCQLVEPWCTIIAKETSNVTTELDMINLVILSVNCYLTSLNSAWIYSVCNLVINHFLGFPIFDISYAQNGKFSFHFSHFHCHLELNKHLFMYRTWLGWIGNECVKDCKAYPDDQWLEQFWEILTHARKLLHVSFFFNFFPLTV